MRLIGYYAWHSFVNCLKKMFKNTFLIVVAGIVAVFVIMGLIGGVVGFTIANVQKDAETSTEAVDTEIILFEAGEASKDDSKDESADDSSDYSDTKASDEDDNVLDLGFLRVGPEADCDLSNEAFVELVVMLVLIFFVMWGIYSGTKKGSDIFLMADVNFLFPAPMKPQSVMMFRLVFQLAGAIVASLYMLGQIPNLVINVGLGGLAIAALFIGWIMLLFLTRIFSVFTYTVASSYNKLKNMAIPIIIVIAAMTLLPATYIYSTTGGDLAAIARAYSADWLRIIPIVGWFKGMVGAALDNNVLMFFVYLGLTLLSFIVMIFVVWHIKVDYYESAIAGAMTRQEMLEKRQNSKPAKVKHRKRERKEYSLKGWGASAFFGKEYLIYRRFAFGGIVSNSMLFFTCIMAAIQAFLYFGFDIRNFIPSVITVVAAVYFKSLSDPHSSESTTTWLMLTPDNPYKKVFYLMLSDTVKLALALLPGLLASAIFAGEKPIIVILWFLTILALDFMLSTVRFMINALVPVKGMDVVKSMIQIMIKMFVIFILVIVFAAGFLIASWTGALVANIIVSVTVGGLLFAIYPSMLHRGIN